MLLRFLVVAGLYLTGFTQRPFLNLRNTTTTQPRALERIGELLFWGREVARSRGFASVGLMGRTSLLLLVRSGVGWSCCSSIRCRSHGRDQTDVESPVTRNISLRPITPQSFIP